MSNQRRLYKPSVIIVDGYLQMLRDLSESPDVKLQKKVGGYAQKVLELQVKHSQISHDYIDGRSCLYLVIGDSMEEGYDVRITSIGTATCTCKGFQFKHRNRYKEFCKHIVAGAHWFVEKGVSVQIQSV